MRWRAAPMMSFGTILGGPLAALRCPIRVAWLVAPLGATTEVVVMPCSRTRPSHGWATWHPRCCPTRRVAQCGQRVLRLRLVGPSATTTVEATNTVFAPGMRSSRRSVFSAHHWSLTGPGRLRSGTMAHAIPWREFSLTPAPRLQALLGLAILCRDFVLAREWVATISLHRARRIARAIQNVLPT